MLNGSIPANANETFDCMLVLLEMLAHDSQQLRNILLDVAARYAAQAEKRPCQECR